MDVANFLRIFSRRAGLLLTCTGLGIFVAIVLTHNITARGLEPKDQRHRVEMQFFLDQPTYTVTRSQGVLVKFLFIGHWHEQWMESIPFAEGVSERVNGAYSPEEIVENINAFGLTPLQMLHVDVHGDTPEDTMALAWAVNAEYQDFVTLRDEEYDVAPESRMTVELINPPNPDKITALSSYTQEWFTFGGLFGLIIGLMIAFSLPMPPRRQQRMPRRDPGDAQPLFSRFVDRVRPNLSPEMWRYLGEQFARRGAVLFGVTLIVVAAILFWQVRWEDGELVPAAGKYRVSARYAVDLPSVESAIADVSAPRLILTPTLHSDIIESLAFTADVSDLVGNSYSPQEILEGMTTAWLPATNILKIDVLGDTPEDAALLAQAVDRTYSEWLEVIQTDAGVGDRNRIVADLVDRLSPADATPETTTVRAWVIYGMSGGLMFGLVLALGAPFPPPPKRREEAEEEEITFDWMGSEPVAAPVPASATTAEHPITIMQ